MQNLKGKCSTGTGNYCGKSGKVEILVEDLAKDLFETDGLAGETVKQTNSA